MSFFDTMHYISAVQGVSERHWEPLEMYHGPRSFHEISFCMDCDGSVFTHQKERFEVKTNDLLFLPKNYEFNQKRESIHTVFLCFQTSDEIALSHDLLTPDNADRMRRYFSEMADVWKKGECGYHYTVLSLANRILSLAMAQRHKESVNGNAHSKAALLEPAFTYICNSFTNPEISVAAMAEMCHISSAYFWLVFKELYGMAPMEYIGNLRMKYAVELLRSGYYSVAEIARRCGLPNQKYFSTFFKRKFGVPPSKY